MRAFTYFEVEDRVYRAPPTNPLQMEIWSPRRKVWEPYYGDAAKVLTDATHLTKPPAGVTKL